MDHGTVILFWTNYGQEMTLMTLLHASISMMMSMMILLHANQGVRMGSEVSRIITSWAVTVKVPAWWFSFIFCLFNSLEIFSF